MKKLNIEQGSPEWHALRKNHIGSSDAPIIMNGEHFGRTPYKLWEEKLGLSERKGVTSAMQRGTDLEPIARQLFMDKMGETFFPATVKSSELDYTMASLDGLNLTCTMALEIKCPNANDHEKAVSGSVPDKYMAQLQHTLAVTGLDMIYYFSYFLTSMGIGTHVTLKVGRDESYIKKLLDKEAEFWECKQSFVAPPLNEKDFVQRQDDTWTQPAAHLLELEREIEELEKEKEHFRKHLIELAGGQNSEGGGIRLNRIIRKGSVDYGKVPMLQGVDLDPYRKSYSESWRITKK